MARSTRRPNLRTFPPARPRVSRAPGRLLRYTEAFRDAFGDGAVTLERICVALAAYCYSIESTESPFDRYRRGDRLPRDRYVILHEGDRVIFDGKEYVVVDTDNGTVLRRGADWYRLPRYDNSEYVRVGDAILRVDPETKAVIELIRLADLILS